MENKPVAWMTDDGKIVSNREKEKYDITFGDHCIPLYTAPRELSDDEIWELHQEYIDEVPCGHSMKTVGFIEFARAILKKASEK